MTWLILRQLWQPPAKDVPEINASSVLGIAGTRPAFRASAMSLSACDSCGCSEKAIGEPHHGQNCG